MKKTLYYACFCYMESTHLYKTYEEAQKELHQLLSAIYGYMPKYHDGFSVQKAEFDMSELYDMSQNPYISANYFIKH